MAKELLIHANYDVALRYKQKMEREGVCSLLGGASFLFVGVFIFPKIIVFYVLAAIFLFLGAISFHSRNSLLDDYENRLTIYRFTPDGWFRNENTVFYHWEDFKKVVFAKNSVTFYESKKHRLHSASISTLLMTNEDFDKAERWLKQYVPSNMRK